jgi:outer membrane protein assembly factor BamA
MSGTAGLGNGFASQLNDSSAQQDSPQSSPTVPKVNAVTVQPSQTRSSPGLSGYEGKVVEAIDLPGVEDVDRTHLLNSLPQKVGEALDRGRVRDSIRALYATGRFADIQAEVTPSGQGITLAFTTLANFFVGAVNVEGAPSRPTQNQIVNASKFQLGELYTREKLEKALENVRQLMQEGG